MKLFSLLPVASAMSTMLYSQQDIDKMRETFKSVAASDKIDDTTRGFIREYMNSINGTLIASLYTVKQDTQSALDSAYDAVEGCKTTRDSAFSGDVSTKAGTRDASRAAHLASKGQQQSGCTPIIVSGDSYTAAFLQQTPDHDYGYNFSRHWGHENDGAANKSYDEENAHHAAELAKTTSEFAAEADMTSKCNTLNTHVQGLQPRAVTGGTFCASDPHSDGTHTRQGTEGSDPHSPNAQHRNIESWEAADDASDTVYVWFSFMDSFESTNVALYKSERIACHDARNAHQHKVKATHRLQHEFERDYCAWSAAIDTACSNYNSCYSSAYSTWSSQNSTAKDIQDQIRAQNHALECLLCYGRQILRTDANPDLNACEGQPCQDCDNFNLVYTDPHDEVSCDEEQTDKPCTGTWEENEYGCFESTTPKDDCVACST